MADQKDGHSQLQIIGAGFGRTGTQSLREALNILGFKCYHMEDVKENFLEDAPKWCEVAQATCQENVKNKSFKVDYNWDNIFKARNYSAAVDFPSSIFYKSQMEYYPNAKVILTIRSSPDVWYKSASNTILKHHRDRSTSLYHILVDKFVFPLRGRFFTTMNKILDYGLLEGKAFSDPERMKDIYSEWIEDVKKHVPKEKLLILDLKKNNGKWDDLCQFLNVSVPIDETTGDIVKFPFSNTTKDKQKQHSRFERRARIFNGIIGIAGVAIVSLMGYLAYSSINQSQVTNSKQKK